VNLGGGLGHLSYSTLVHPGDTWEAMRSSLETYLPQVKARVTPDAPFGVSLRLAAASARTLAGSAEERARLRDFLAAQDLYVYTVNAFVHGDFKDTVVKERVYLARLGETQTTRDAIEQALELHRTTPQSRHLEIETYTWDVLPDEFKTGDIVDHVSRELEWVRSQLVPAGGADG
jgi:hypothetical protein